MGVDQRTGEGSNPRITLVVSKSDSSHGSATTANRTLGLTPASTICHSNLSLRYYPIHNPRPTSGEYAHVGARRFDPGFGYDHHPGVG